MASVVAPSPRQGQPQDQTTLGQHEACPVRDGCGRKPKAGLCCRIRQDFVVVGHIDGAIQVSHGVGDGFPKHRHQQDFELPWSNRFIGKWLT